MEPRLVVTEDGSNTLYAENYDEHYHSVHGALQESMHVFINAGLRQKLSNQTIDILETGFGTGLNALLTCIEAEKHKMHVNYTSVEKFPIAAEMSSKLNYCALTDVGRCNSFWNDIQQCEWEQMQPVSAFFNLKKTEMNIEDINYKEQFDIIYFDAFAPSAQPELWTEAIFRSMYNALRPNGILVTYCAKGVVKRTMKSVGFVVEALPGPKGKREITHCVKL